MGMGIYHSYNVMAFNFELVFDYLLLIVVCF